MSDKDVFLDEQSEKEAIDWVWRLDAGVSSEEQDAFFDWMAQKPMNSAAFAKHRRNWKRLDNVANWMPKHSDKPNPDLLAPGVDMKRSMAKYGIYTLAAAALFMVGLLTLFLSGQFSDRSTKLEEASIVSNRILLDDTSVIRLKDDALVTVMYTESERRIRLDRGEAFFIVAHNPERPFVVDVGGMDVSALGTAFNVRLDSHSFEVLVSEGKVKVEAQNASEDSISKAMDDSPLLLANQRAIVPLEDVVQSPEIATLTQGEVHRVLAWQHGLMTFNSQSLSEIAYELNHFNETQLVILDDSLAQKKFSGSFRSDNMAGFVRLLEAAFGANAVWKEDSEVLLSSNFE